jgi:hypothetical protein
MTQKDEYAVSITVFAVTETEREAVEKARRKIADGKGAAHLQHKREVKD